MNSQTTSALTLDNLDLAPEKWREGITLPSRITPQQFGCTTGFFNAKIRGQKLTVTGYFGGFLWVEVDGQAFSVHESDLEPNGHNAEEKEIAWRKIREQAGTPNEW